MFRIIITFYFAYLILIYDIHNNVEFTNDGMIEMWTFGLFSAKIKTKTHVVNRILHTDSCIVVFIIPAENTLTQYM